MKVGGHRFLSILFQNRLNLKGEQKKGENQWFHVQQMIG